MCIGGLCFAKLGICVAFWASNFDQQSAIANFVLTPLIYLGGVFFSLEHLHPFWIAVSKANPLFYFINGVRYGVLGQADVEPGRAIVVASISLIVLHIMARRSIKNGSYTRW